MVSLFSFCDARPFKTLDTTVQQRLECTIIVFVSNHRYQTTTVVKLCTTTSKDRVHNISLALCVLFIRKADRRRRRPVVVRVSRRPENAKKKKKKKKKNKEKTKIKNEKMSSSSSSSSSSLTTTTTTLTTTTTTTTRRERWKLGRDATRQRRKEKSLSSRHTDRDRNKPSCWRGNRRRQPRRRRHRRRRRREGFYGNEEEIARFETFLVEQCVHHVNQPDQAFLDSYSPPTAFDEMVLQNKSMESKGTMMGVVALITGSTVGAGILALPSVCARLELCLQFVASLGRGCFYCSRRCC